MANTTIQLKSSTVTAAPASLSRAEPAYSYASNTFFIGSPDGTGAIAIGGKFYLDQQQNIFDSVNAAFTAANSGASSTSAFNQANSAFFHANSAFDTANGAVAVNTTQNNSIAASFAHANAAFSAANNATDTYVRNHANSAFDTANGAVAVNLTQNNSIAAAFARANNSLDANTGGTITGDVVINANLFVNGTTTYVNTVNQLIGDNIITLNADLPQGGTPTQDAGFEIERGVQPNSSFLWTESAGKWAASDGNTSFYLNPSIDSTTGGSITGALGVTGNVYAGNVIANGAVTSTRITAGSTVIGGINVVPTLASSYDTANSAFIHANAAFAAANSGASSAGAFNHANAAFDTANSAVAVNTTQNNSISASFAHANAAFSAANSAASAASSAQGTADGAATAASNAQGTADGAVAVNATQNTNITTANNTAVAAFIHANAAFAAANTSATASASVFNTTGDGTTKTFNLGFTPVSDGSASVVSIDGIIQYEGTWSITTGNTSINFSDAPGAGERIRVLAYTSVNPYVLGPTGVTAGSYGNANTIAVFTTAANGQLTFATNTAIAIGASQITSGELGVARGGTGAGTFTTNGVLLGQGTSAFQTASSSTEGHVLTINASGVPTFEMVSGGTF